MAWKILFCVFLLLNICQSLSNFNKGKLQEYIRKRRENTSAILSELNEDSQDDSQIYVQFLGNEAFTSLNQSVAKFEAFTLFNKIYVFMDRALYLLNMELPAVSHPITQIFEINSQEDVVFVKNVEFGNNGIIFTALSNGSSVVYFYSRVTNKWFFIQSIEKTDKLSDALFLQNQNNLYLIVASNNGNSFSRSLIYKWVDSYFDKVDEVITKHIVRVLAFTENERKIIAFLERPKNYERNLVVYQFQEDDGVKKVQVIKNLSANSVALYNYQDKSYLAVFEETKNSILYHWTEDKFVYLKSLGRYPNISKTVTTYIQSYPIVFAIQNKKIISFVHSANNLEEGSPYQLEHDYVQILDMEVILRNNEHTLFFFLSTKSTIDYTATNFAISSKKLEMENHETKPLEVCLSNLKKKYYKNAVKLNVVIDYVKSKLNATNLLDSNPIVQKFPSHLIENLELKNNMQNETANIRNDVNKLKKRIKQILPQLDMLFQDGDTITGNLVVENELDGDTLETKNLDIKNFNNVLWNPDSWLSYSKAQNITGPIAIQELNSNSIVLQNDSFYYDIISKSIKFQNIHELDSLIADTLYSDKINNISMDDLYSRKNPVKINGTKSFQHLAVEKLKADIFNNQNEAETAEFLLKLKDKNLEIKSNVVIKDLHFDTINDVDWKNFKDSVFRIGKSQHIKGSLRAQTVNTTKLNANSISNINSSFLFTLTTDQRVSSNISFTSFTVRKIDCPIINNLNFSNQVIWKNNSFIRGPVSFDHLIIKKILKGANGSKLIVDQKDANELSDMEFLQVYENVRIIGNLHIKDLETSNSANLLINKKIFNHDDIDTYWLKNKNQVIQNHIEATKGISTPYLKTNLLNNVEVSRYMRNNLENKLPTNLLFENITVIGNIVINSSDTHSPDLKKIYSEAVKKEGSFNITGHKTILGDISVGNLVTNYLDSAKVSEALTVKNLDKISKIEFENLVIKGNVSSVDLIANSINHVDLKDLDDKVVFKNRPEIVEEMRANDISAQFVNISRINGMDFDEYLNYGNIIRDLKILKDVRVYGDVYIKNAQNVSSINNFTFNELLGDKISNNVKNVQFNHSIRFLDDVFAEEVEVDVINNINITKLLNRLLYRNGDQNITAEYMFDKIITSDIRVPKINEIHTANIIDTHTKNPQTLTVKERGLQLTSPKFLKSLNAKKLLCNIQEAVNYLKSFPTLVWEKVFVMKNVELWNDSGDLYRILNKSFKPYLNNIITAPITFEHGILANSLNLGMVNGLDFNFTVNDAVLNYGDQQVITGRKKFNSLELSKGIVYENVDIPIINKLDIKLINRSIIFKHNLNESVIKGAKTFYYGLEANELISSQMSDINANVVSLKNLSTIPSVYFQSLEVDNNLSFELINSLNVSHILKTRILRNSTVEQIASGSYYLDNVELAGNSHFNHINDLEIENIVFDVDKQVISGSNAFVQDVVVHQNISLDLINGINITSEYEASIMNDQMVNTSGNIKFNNDTAVNKKIVTDNINGIPLNQLIELMEANIPYGNAKISPEARVHNISSLVKHNFAISDKMPSTFLYLEHSQDVQIFLYNVTSARVGKINGNVILNILHQKLGSSCGFTDDCLCFSQEDIEITEELSINTIAELNNQVIYSYNDDKMSMHIQSYCMGENKFCHTQNENEFIKFNWIINFPKEASGSYTYSDISKSYIKNVEFFQFAKYVYAVVVKNFNNPNFSNLICVIYKFDSKQKTIIEIQKIESSGSLIHLFETKEGVHLILRAAHNPHNASIPVTETEIYRFNENANLFHLHDKIIGPAPVDITTMVVDEKSLIIFAYDRNVEIFEYNSEPNSCIKQIGKSFKTKIVGMSVFYIGFAPSDPYLCIVENTGDFYIYSFNDREIIYSGIIQGLIKLLPFTLNNSHYLFAVSTDVSYVLTIVQQGFY